MEDETSSTFKWLPAYDAILENIAATDIVDTEWMQLRDIIKYKIDENIASYLSEPQRDTEPLPLADSQARPLLNGGLRLPPFPPRERIPGNPNEAPKSILTPEDAGAFKEIINEQLYQFDGTPFTIQRVCELCLQPRRHYKTLGKYLRAVEKSLLVTSTWNAFPVVSESESNHANVLRPLPLSAFPSTPSTPMFSPIPFLHGDARRSASRSPPPSPLSLAVREAGRSVSPTHLSGSEVAEQKAIGLVDELDDPSPGHLSDHPQAISATTTVTSRPFLGSLGDRFVLSGTVGGGAQNSGGADSALKDDSEDKENKGK